MIFPYRHRVSSNARQNVKKKNLFKNFSAIIPNPYSPNIEICMGEKKFIPDYPCGNSRPCTLYIKCFSVAGVEAVVTPL